MKKLSKEINQGLDDMTFLSKEKIKKIDEMNLPALKGEVSKVAQTK